MIDTQERRVDLVDPKAGERQAFLAFGLLALAWSILFVSTAIPWSWFAELPHGLLALAGAGGAIVLFIGGFAFRSLRTFLLGIVVLSMSMVTLTNNMEPIKAHATLALNEQRYAKIVDSLEEAPDRAYDEVWTDQTTGSLIVVFDLGAGLIDDCKSIAHDPNGALANRHVYGLSEDLPFGGNYKDVVHLRGPWYFVNMYPDAF